MTMIDRFFELLEPDIERGARAGLRMNHVPRRDD